MMKKGIVLFTVLFLFVTIPQVNAENDVFVSILQKSVAVTAGEPFTVDVRVTNLGLKEETFNLVVLDIDWIVGPTNTIVSVPPGKSGEAQVTVTPSLKLDPGKYLLQIAASPVSGGVSDIGGVVVDVKAPPSKIVMSLVSPQERLSSINRNKLIISLRNTNNYEEKGLILKIKGGPINEKISLENLGGLETNRIEPTLYLGPETPPGELTLTFELIKGKETVSKLEKTFTVSAEEIISEFEAQDEVFLQKIESVKKVNEGNVLTGAAITREVNIFDRWVTRFDPLPSRLERDGVSYTAEWAFSLEPGASYTVTKITDYQILALIIFISLMLAIFLYSVLRKRIVISKRLITLKKGKDGVSEIKVVLNLRNRGGTTHGVKIMDNVPPFAELHKEFGTVKPSDVKQTKNGTLIVWNIDKFSKNEEVILSYQIKCKLRIIGSFMLPRARVSFKRSKKTIKIYSSPLVLTPEKG